MAVKVVAGDLKQGKWQFSGAGGGAIMVSADTSSLSWKMEKVNLVSSVETLEQLTEEKVKKLAGTAGWGLAGAALLGPLGAVGGMLLGGNKKQVSFVAYLKDGRKFMATTDGKTWEKIQAARF